MAGKKRKKPSYVDISQEIEEMKEWEKQQTQQECLNYKVNCKFMNKKQKEMSNVIRNNRITFVSAPAGCGKTFIALKTGLELLQENNNFSEILLTMPVVEAGNRSLGALPGNLEEKTSNYFESLYDNIDKIIGIPARKTLCANGLITDKIVSFIRGATFGKIGPNRETLASYCICDETQNLTISELKTYLSRLGSGSCMVIIGDSDQVDIKLRHNELDSITDAKQRFGDLDGVGIVEFTEDDIVRDPFLIEIMKRYKK